MLIGTNIKLNIPVRSDKLLLLEDFVQGSITFSSRSHESWDGNDGVLAEVDGSIIIDLGYKEGTSAMEIWMDE